MGRGGPGGPAGPEGFTLFVHGLAPEVKEGEIWQLFGPFGAINKVDIIRDESKGGQCKGFGFVTMRDYGEAEHAVTALNGYNIGEYQYGQKRFLQVRFKDNKNGGGPAAPGPQGGFGAGGGGPGGFGGPAGGGGPGGFGGPGGGGFGGRFGGGPGGGDAPGFGGLSAGFGAAGPRRPPMRAGNMGPGHILFVHGLPPDTEENDLWQLFEQYGTIQKVDIIRDLKQNNQCKGFGFVTMAEKDEGERAIQALDKYKIGHKALQVRWKTDNKKE